LAVKPAAALAALNPLPLMPSAALEQATPEPLDQLENVTPVGGVVYVAVGVAGQVTEAPPPTVTTVWPHAVALIANTQKAAAKQTPARFMNLPPRLRTFFLVFAFFTSWE
jgi:hypothetical protein